MEPRLPRTAERAASRVIARHEELLAGLRDLFLAEGFLRFGVGELAERLRCSRTTLYSLAPTKEQLVLLVIRSWFRDQTATVESEVEQAGDPVEAIQRYLRAVADALAPASPKFHADLAEFAPAGEIYRRNTEIAAGRVRDLVAAGVETGALRQVDTAFVGAVVGRMMTGIQNGEIAAATGLDDAMAYEHLADLLLHGLRTATTVQ